MGLPYPPPLPVTLITLPYPIRLITPPLPDTLIALPVLGATRARRYPPSVLALRLPALSAPPRTMSMLPARRENIGENIGENIDRYPLTLYARARTVSVPATGGCPEADREIGERHEANGHRSGASCSTHAYC